MTIFITGDTHGRLDMGKLLGMNFDARGLGRDDYVIIVGDFGLVWYDDPKSTAAGRAQEDTLDWLDAKPWTTLFVDGNHDNHDRLDIYDVEVWNGGCVHKIRPNVIHLMRGEIFDICDKSFFCMGGAGSIDKDRRCEGRDWWAAEIPSEVERSHAIDTLDKHGWTCDYVLTHDCPSNVKFDLGCRTGLTYVPDAWEEWLQFIADKLDFKQWFFGHFHQDYRHIGLGGKFTTLYDYIYDLDDDNWSDRMEIRRITGFDQLPKSAERHGYSLDEIADITHVDRSVVETVVGREMYGSSVGVREDGEILIYPQDMFRVLDWC